MRLNKNNELVKYINMIPSVEAFVRICLKKEVQADMPRARKTDKTIWNENTQSHNCVWILTFDDNFYFEMGVMTNKAVTSSTADANSIIKYMYQNPEEYILDSIYNKPS